MSDSTPEYPNDEPPVTSPAIGKDEWVARHYDRRLPPRLGPLEQRIRQVPWWLWLLLALGVACLLPVFSGNPYVRQVGFDTCIYVLLALGLNVVVGWGGLLDLGYVAFYGFGAYAYALMESGQFDVHVPTIVAIPAIVAAGAGVGLLLGLPSRRLSGDYLAIVTLFFLQLFQTLTTNGDQVFGTNITGGANGILRIDPLSFFGHALPTQHQGIFAVSYYYVAIVFFVLVF